MIDTSKLADGIKAFMNAIQKQRYAEERERLSTINATEEVVELQDGTTLAASPALYKHGIPLNVSSIHVFLHDIVNLSPKFLLAIICNALPVMLIEIDGLRLLF